MLDPFVKKIYLNKLEQREKEKYLDQQSWDPSVSKLPKTLKKKHYKENTDGNFMNNLLEFDPLTTFFNGVTKITGNAMLSKSLGKFS